MPLLDVHERTDRTVVVCLRDRVIAKYYMNPDGSRPYLGELWTPNGVNVLGDTPRDHPHHHGIWLGHAKVNGLDFWREDGGEGRLIHRAMLAKLSGEDRGIFAVLNDWRDVDGKKILENETTYIVHEPVEHGFNIDIIVRLRASEGDVDFAECSESGLPFIRVADKLDVNSGGCITNADGMVNEAATFGKRSPWCDYSGPLDDGSYAGVAVFDFPGNRGYPTAWFTRDYGVISPNSTLCNGGFKLRKGKDMLFRYRFYVHDGTLLRARVAREHDRFLEMIQEAKDSIVKASHN